MSVVDAESSAQLAYDIAVAIEAAGFGAAAGVLDAAADGRIRIVAVGRNGRPVAARNARRVVHLVIAKGLGLRASLDGGPWIVVRQPREEDPT